MNYVPPLQLLGERARAIAAIIAIATVLGAAYAAHVHAQERIETNAHGVLRNAVAVERLIEKFDASLAYDREQRDLLIVTAQDTKALREDVEEIKADLKLLLGR